MDDEEVLELAPVAIERVAHIATHIGATRLNEVCGRLGGELLIAASFLGSPEQEVHEQHDRFLQTTRKLLRDVEKICNWPENPNSNLPLLKCIGWGHPEEPLYLEAVQDIKSGLVSLTGGSPRKAEEFILHFKRYNKRFGKQNLVSNEPSGASKVIPDDHGHELTMVAYNVLQKHMCCECMRSDNLNPQRHGTKLLLRPSLSLNTNDATQLDLLFSSKAYKRIVPTERWQDIKLVVPREEKTLKKQGKRVKFCDHDDATIELHRLQITEEVKYGQLCKLISNDINSRVCLTIQDEKLRLMDPEPLKQIIADTPSLSLATLLRTYHLSQKMKAALAYTIAHSVWKFYDSDWMKTRWTSETIHFMRESTPPLNTNELGIFTSKPYFSVDFGADDANAYEHSTIRDDLHKYPRVRALGILLVEIGVGSVLPRVEGSLDDLSQMAQTNNSEWIWANKYSESNCPWPNFDLGSYRKAVKNCLDPQRFRLPPVSGEDMPDKVQQRRKLLYENVVAPLDELMKGTGWKEELQTIEPLKETSKLQIPVRNTTLDSQRTSDSQGSTKRSSRRWLQRVKKLTRNIYQSVDIDSRRRVRIAILDTGYDPGAEFFYSPIRYDRLVKWKDWVSDSMEPIDTHGHGTHLISLIMKISPDAEICVARVAKDPADLDNASQNVADAINWAQAECKADIISMSFGYVHDQGVISKAIRTAVNDREESILFFASAANSGSNEEEMFPACHECVISIRGTNSNGAFQDFNPPKGPQEHSVYGTLGLEVPSSALAPESGEVYKSGTSVATAIAAGLAGLFLGYVSQKFRQETSISVNRKLRTRKGMLAMFDYIAKDSLSTGYKYVAPWFLEGDERYICSIFEGALARLP